MAHSQIMHALNAILSFYLFILFSFWWMKRGKATYIYRITCFLMLGLFATHAGAYFLYFDGVISPVDYHLMNCWYWPLRQYLILLPLIAYAIHATHKIFTGKDKDTDR